MPFQTIEVNLSSRIPYNSISSFLRITTVQKSRRWFSDGIHLADVQTNLVLAVALRTRKTNGLQTPEWRPYRRDLVTPTQRRREDFAHR